MNPADGTGTAHLATGEERPPLPRRSWKRAALRLGGSAVALGLLLYFLPAGQLASMLAGVPIRVWVGAVVLYVVLQVGFGATKWRIIVNAAGAALTLRQSVRCYMLGMFGNVFLPSVVGGDVVRAAAAYPLARSKGGLVLGSLVDRMVDALALATVAGIGILLSPAALPPESRTTFVVAAGLLVVVGVVGGTCLAFLPANRFPARIERGLGAVRTAAGAMARHPAPIAAAFAMAVSLQTLLVVLTAWLARAAGLDASLVVWLFVWPLAKLSALLPVTQGGLGVREAAQAALFAPFGIPATAAVGAGLAFQAVIMAGHLMAGGIALLMPRRRPGEPGGYLRMPTSKARPAAG